ncbi:MAG: sulfotransferase [Myxococcota bacterium]
MAQFFIDPTTAKQLLRWTFGSSRGSVRRAGYFAGFAGLFGVVNSSLYAAQRMDDLLYPRYRSQEIVAPLFVFSNPRSGSTWLHNLLSLDEERFTNFQLWQTIFPSVCANRTVNIAERLEAHLGKPFKHWIELVNEFFFTRWNGIHDTGLSRPEEDEAIFVLALLGSGLILLFPEAVAYDRVNSLDELEEPVRRGMMDVYRKSIQRHLYANGGRTLLTKNVFTATRVRSLLETFPDARFLYIMRDPLDAIPSCINLFHVPWTAHTPSIYPKGPETRAVADWAIRQYQHALACRDFVPPSQFALVRYEDLSGDPTATVEEVYQKFGYEMKREFRRKLEDATKDGRSDSFKSTQRFTLEYWGIERAYVYDRLRPLFDEFGYKV